MKLEIQTGVPTMEGLHVVFVECAVPRAWTEPHIVLWHQGRWMHRNSFMPYLDPVYAWIKLPPISKEQCAAIDFELLGLDESRSYQAAVTKRAQEYDL